MINKYDKYYKIINELIENPPKFNKDNLDESNNKKDEFVNTYNKFKMLANLVNGSKKQKEYAKIIEQFNTNSDEYVNETYDQDALLVEIDKLIIDLNNLTQQLTVDNAEKTNKDFQFISDRYKKLLTQMTMDYRTIKSGLVAKAFNEYKTKIGAITPKNRWPSFGFKFGGKRKSHRTKKNASRKLASRKLVNKKRASNKKRGTQKIK